MKLTPRGHELLSCTMLGLATLFMYLGFHSQSFISESVIHSIHAKHPDRISQYAGYYGQAVCYTATTISTLFTPYLTHHFASKWILVSSAILFGIYHLGFFYVNSYLFYITQALMGLAYSLYTVGEGVYLAEHSSRKTVETNTSLETSVGHTSMFAGGICLLAIFYFFPGEIITESNFRTFSEFHIKVMYGTFFAIDLIAITIFALLPTTVYENSIAAAAPQTTYGFKEQLVQLRKTLLKPNMLLLACTFLYMGFTVSFLLGIYPTTLSFTSSLKNDQFIIAFYSMGVGFAETSGLMFRPILKRCGRYKLFVTMSLHIFVMSVMLIVLNLSVPNMATIRPTSEETIIEPSRITAILIGYLMGLGDYALTVCRTSICQLAVPENRGEVFSLTRLFQCLASCLVLFMSPMISVRRWTIILGIGMVIGAFTYYLVAWKINQTTAISDSSNEKKQTQEDTMKTITVH